MLAVYTGLTAGDAAVEPGSLGAVERPVFPVTFPVPLPNWELAQSSCMTDYSLDFNLQPSTEQMPWDWRKDRNSRWGPAPPGLPPSPEDTMESRRAVATAHVYVLHRGLRAGSFRGPACPGQPGFCGNTSPGPGTQKVLVESSGWAPTRYIRNYSLP